MMSTKKSTTVLLTRSGCGVRRTMSHLGRGNVTRTWNLFITALNRIPASVKRDWTVMACGEPPEGRASWTLKLLADHWSKLVAILKP